MYYLLLTPYLPVNVGIIPHYKKEHSQYYQWSQCKHLCRTHRDIQQYQQYERGGNTNEPFLNPYVIIISICLRRYFRLDITSNTLRFSINPEEAYIEPVKALDDQNQSLPIVASTSDASLRLRPNTPTLKRTLIDTYTNYKWDSAGSIQSEVVFRTIGKIQPRITLT